MRRARAEAGISLGRMAGQTHYSKSLLGHIETGRRSAREEHVIAYSQVLGLSPDTFRRMEDDPIRLAHEWLVCDSPSAIHSAAGGRVGVSLAEALERRVAELRRLDDVLGGDQLSPLVRDELADVRRLVGDVSCSDEVRRRLFVVLGELSQLVGWVCSDAGEHEQAQRIYLSGVEAARAAGDREIAGQLLSSLSYEWANAGKPGDAALLAKSAVRGLSQAATPLVRALLTERVAWACAKAGDREDTERALDIVDELYENRGAAEPEWVYWLDRGEIDIMAGRCRIELGRPDIAEPLLSAALAHYAPDHVREVALYKTWLSEAHANNGAMDAARSTLDEARRLAADAHSSRLDRRIREISEPAA